MKTVFYHGDFDGKGKRVLRSTVLRVLESNLPALQRMGHETAKDAIEAIEDDAVLAMPDGTELWQEEG